MRVLLLSLLVLITIGCAVADAPMWRFMVSTQTGSGVVTRFNDGPVTCYVLTADAGADHTGFSGSISCLIRPK